MSAIKVCRSPCYGLIGLQSPPTLALRHGRPAFRLYSQTSKQAPSLAFAFDIDGVLLRSSKPLLNARKTLEHLQNRRIPFILLTNGGGKSEEERVEQVSQLLDIPLDRSMFVQSHTPFQQLVDGKFSSDDKQELKTKTVLVVGGDGDRCRQVAKGYGFQRVIIPGDIITAYPQLMPFADPERYKVDAQPLDRRLSPQRLDPHSGKEDDLKVDAILVFNDPRDWVLDVQVIVDLLLSQSGYLGSLSPKNGDASLPNKGYQQDGQPPIYFSNPDLFWAAEYHLPRFGQGAFREALEGVWNATTGGEKAGVTLKKTMIGKPFQKTFDFAEQRLLAHRAELHGNVQQLQDVYMVGDNPESDILGANRYRSPRDVRWHSILVRTGVYDSGEPRVKPTAIVHDVWEATQLALRQSSEQVLL